MNDLKIEIIKTPTKEKPYIILYKPSGLPSAPLTENDKTNALNMAGELFPEVYSVSGKKQIEYGLLHRIDTVTSGLLVIATEQTCYEKLLLLQEQGKINKTYSAICDISENKIEGFPVNNLNIKLQPNSNFTIQSYFRPFGKGRKEVRPVTKDSNISALKKLGKPVLYSTNVKILEIDSFNKKTKVECNIVNGYRHQVRCHLSWIGLPIENDNTYNEKCKNDSDKKNAENQIKFSATKIEFEYPEGDLNSYVRKNTWT